VRASLGVCDSTVESVDLDHNLVVLLGSGGYLT